MATAAQILANRRNSQLSTGPRSPEGKAASRFNALKSGVYASAQVIPGEDPAELEALAEAYNQQFQPCGPLERFLVDSLVNAEWQLRRYRKIEAALWQREASLAGDPLAVFDSPAFLRLQRLIQFAERSYHRNLKQLQKSQQQENEEDSAELASFRQNAADRQSAPVRPHPAADSEPPHRPGSPDPMPLAEAS